MSSSIKVSRTSSPPSKRISVRISIRVRLRSVEIIEPEMSPDFWPYVQLNGTPRLTFRRGKSNHSNQWIPIVSAAQLLQELKLSLKSRTPVYWYSCIIFLSHRPNSGLLPLWCDRGLTMRKAASKEYYSKRSGAISAFN